MSTISRRTALQAGLAVLATGLVVGCGEEPPPPAAEAGPGVGEVTTGPDGVQEITVQTQDDYVFIPAAFTVAPGPVRLTVVNVARELTHNFRFTPGSGPEPIEAAVDLLAPGGQEATIEFEVTEPGEHRYECSFHTQLGQIGTMTVRAQR